MQIKEISAIFSLTVFLVISGCASNAIIDNNSNFKRANSRIIDKIYISHTGENLIQIGQKFGIDINSLRRANPKYNIIKKIPVDMPVFLPHGILPKSGDVLYKTSAGDTIAKLARHFQMSVYSLLKVNNLTEKQGLRIGQSLNIPLSKRDKYKYIWPVLHPSLKDGSYFRSPRLQSGLILHTKKGVGVYAVDDGKVVFANSMRGLGRVIVILHKNKIQSVYTFCSNIAVKENQIVKRGKKIAEVGFQTRSNSYGIYFELRQNKKKLSPESYLPVIKINEF